ncbi:MAG: cysteine desulfurase/selenocysteine lyase [Gammaproteobacteria bacterium]|jgi:cysteine desulfurase/selenocysteine lyase
MVDTSLLQKIQHSFIGQHTHYPLVDGSSGPRHYFDSAASTLMMRPAFDVAQNFLEHYSSTHSELHFSARGANRAFDWAHQRVLDFVAADADIYSAYFAGSGATAGFNRIASELAALRPDRDIIIASEMEHHSNDLPHRAHGAKVIHLPLMGEAANCGGIDIEVARETIEKYGDRINYLAITAASNVTGAITPIHELAQLAHSVGAYIVVDASQMIAHAPISMQSAAVIDTGIDVLVFSGHKIYAPGSPGVVIARSSLLNQTTPSELGGGMVEDVFLQHFTPSALLPDRKEAGTPNIIGAITLAAALDILMRIGMQTIRDKEIGLINLAWTKLMAIEGVNLYGPDPSQVPRTGTIAFNIKGLDHGLTAAALNDYHNIQVRNGCFCAHPYVREMVKRELWAMNIDPDAPNIEAEVERKRGMARASLGIYTTEADVLALCEAVEDLVSRHQEILEQYSPEGKSGYCHRSFKPDEDSLFNPSKVLETVLKSL